VHHPSRRYSRALALIAALATVASWTATAFAGPLDNICAGWRYHVGDDPSWSRADFDDSGWAERSLDSRWPGGPDAAAADTVWYRRRLPPVEVPHRAIVIGPIESAYELYVDGVLTARVGELEPIVSPSPLQPIAHELPARRGEIVVALRVMRAPHLRGHRYASGPLGGPCAYGSLAACQTLIASARDRAVSSNVVQLVLAAVFLVVALQQLALYRRRRDLSEYLWFALLSISMGVDALVVFEQSAVVSGIRPISSKATGATSSIKIKASKIRID
jgi:hypothetical protein